MNDTNKVAVEIKSLSGLSINQPQCDIKVAATHTEVPSSLQPIEEKKEAKLAEPPKEPEPKIIDIKIEEPIAPPVLSKSAVPAESMNRCLAEEKRDKPGMMTMQTVIMEEEVSYWLCCRKNKSSHSDDNEIMEKKSNSLSSAISSEINPKSGYRKVDLKTKSTPYFREGCCWSENGICSWLVCDDENYCGPNVDSNIGHGIFDCSPSSQCGMGWASLVMMFLGLILVFIYCGVGVYAKWEGDISRVLEYYYGIISAAIFMLGVFTKAGSLWQVMSSHEKYIMADTTWFNALVMMINVELMKEKCNKMKADLKLPQDFQFDRSPSIGSWGRTSTRLMYVVIIGIIFIIIGLITMCAPGLIIYAMLFTFFGTGLFFLASWGIQSMYSISVENRREKSLHFQDLARDLECPNLKIAELQFEHEITSDFPSVNPTQDQICTGMHIHKLKYE